MEPCLPQGEKLRDIIFFKYYHKFATTVSLNLPDSSLLSVHLSIHKNESGVSTHKGAWSGYRSVSLAKRLKQNVIISICNTMPSSADSLVFLMNITWLLLAPCPGMKRVNDIKTLCFICIGTSSPGLINVWSSGAWLVLKLEEHSPPLPNPHTTTHLFASANCFVVFINRYAEMQIVSRFHLH